MIFGYIVASYVFSTLFARESCGISIIHAVIQWRRQIMMGDIECNNYPPRSVWRPKMLLLWWCIRSSRLGPMYLRIGQTMLVDTQEDLAHPYLSCEYIWNPWTSWSPKNRNVGASWAYRRQSLWRNSRVSNEACPSICESLEQLHMGQRSPKECTMTRITFLRFVPSQVLPIDVLRRSDMMTARGSLDRFILTVMEGISVPVTRPTFVRFLRSMLFLWWTVLDSW